MENQQDHDEVQGANEDELERVKELDDLPLPVVTPVWWLS